MRFLFAFLLCVFCINAYAGENSAYDLSAELNMQYNDLIDTIETIEPSFAKSLENLDISKRQKISMIRSFLAQKTWNLYKDDFKQIFCNKSAETNRKILHNVCTELVDSAKKCKNTEKQSVQSCTDIKDGDSYWLDRGELEKSECLRNGTVVCEYPDNFEHCSLDTNGLWKLLCDDKKHGVTIIKQVGLSSPVVGGNANFNLFVTFSEMPYEQTMKLREQYRQLELGEIEDYDHDELQIKVNEALFIRSFEQ